MFADPDKVSLRRIKRQLKAGASIVLALAAGAFLACQRSPTRPQGSSPMGPDARGDHQDPIDASAADATNNRAETGLTHEGGTDASPEGGSALAVRDAGSDGAQRVHVDRHEHRSGMPVRDNLLE